VIRRITSPTRCPWLFAWYPDAVPGSHHGRCMASRSVAGSQSYMSRIEKGCSQPETPDVCDIRCRTSTSFLPFAANSGQ
jgi:hypothetical protein